MGFNKQAALYARGDGAYGARVLLLGNVSAYVATAVTITFTGQRGEVALLTEPQPARLGSGEVVTLPLRRARPGAVFRVVPRWQEEQGGEPGVFFGVAVPGV